MRGTGRLIGSLGPATVIPLGLSCVARCAGGSELVAEGSALDDTADSARVRADDDPANADRSTCRCWLAMSNGGSVSSRIDTSRLCRFSAVALPVLVAVTLDNPSASARPDSTRSATGQ